MNEMLRAVVYDLERDNNGHVSRQERQHLVRGGVTVRKLQDLSIDVYSLVGFADFFYDEKDELSLDDFKTLLLQLRRTNTGTVLELGVLYDSTFYISAVISGIVNRWQVSHFTKQ